MQTHSDLAQSVQRQDYKRGFYRAGIRILHLVQRKSNWKFDLDRKRRKTNDHRCGEEFFYNRALQHLQRE